MITTIFLWANALLYLGLAAWCTLAPSKTSEAIGFAFTKPAGRSEYITVYGGLELGLAIFFLVAALNPSFRDAGVLFALATYGCLAIYRLVTLLTIEGTGTFPIAMFAIELPMALLAAYLYFKA